MKKILTMTVAAATVFLASIVPASAWGLIGHSTIAQVAQNHLTPKAEKALNKYLDGNKLAISIPSRIGQDNRVRRTVPARDVCLVNNLVVSHAD